MSPSVLEFVLRATGSTNYVQIYFGMLYNDGTEVREFNTALNNRCECWLTQPLSIPIYSNTLPLMWIQQQRLKSKYMLQT